MCLFGGSHAAVADYLLDDVLSRLPEASRAFLLAVSVLEDLDPPLCDALTGRSDSAALLASLEQAGLFIVAQSPDDRSYRFHPLFRDFLRDELARSDPAAAPRLNRSASHWYLEHDRPVPALEHLIRSGDSAAAIDLLAIHAEPLLWQGRMLLLARWFFDRLPEAGSPGADAGLKCAYAWSLLFTHRHREALAQFDQVEARGNVDEPVRAQLAVGRAFILAMTDQVAEALAAWEACKGRFATEAQPFLHSIQHNSHAFCLTAANRFDEALDVVAQGKPSHRRIGSSFNLAVSACLEGAIDLAQGRVGAAAMRCREALAAATTHPGQHVSGSTIAAAFLAEACYAAGLLVEAERLLDAYLPMIDGVAAPDQVITSHVTLARLAWRHGRRDRAIERLDLLERQGIVDQQPRLCAAARLERCRIALLDGSVAAARIELDKGLAADRRDPGEALLLHASDVEGPVLAAARLSIHAGRALEAIAPLRTAIARAESQQRLRRAHHLRILLALALARSGDEAEALELALGRRGVRREPGAGDGRRGRRAGGDRAAGACNGRRPTPPSSPRQTRRP